MIRSHLDGHLEVLNAILHTVEPEIRLSFHQDLR
jgi:hypothetical protein